MRNYLMGILLLLTSCQNTPKPAETSSFTSNDSMGVQEKNELPASNLPAEEGSILYETNKLLNLINTNNTCRFEHAEGTAPNTDIVGETNIMQAEVTSKEAENLIKLFYQKCHDSKLEKFNNDNTFWREGKYNLKGFFNIADAKNSYFTCLISGNNKYTYYVLGNP